MPSLSEILRYGLCIVIGAYFGIDGLIDAIDLFVIAVQHLVRLL